MDRLSDFVDEHLRKGVSTSEMKAHLISNGWKESEVDNAITSATGRKTKRRITYAFIGILIVAVLALVLISLTKFSAPPAVLSTGNTNNVNLGQTNTAESCMNKEYSNEKDECYKKLLSTGLDCETLEDNIEFTYCTRAYEEINLEGIETTSENLT